MLRAQPWGQEGRPIPASLGARFPHLKPKDITGPLWAPSHFPSHQPSASSRPCRLGLEGGNMAGAGRRVPCVLAVSSGSGEVGDCSGIPRASAVTGARLS